ncbi:hypothetical protein ACFLRU_05465 [Bacteroidota bacterium]
MKKTLLFLVVLCFSVTANAQLFKSSKKKANEQTKLWRYETICSGVGVQGTVLLKVYSYSKKPRISKEQSKKNAVHAVIFKGFVGGNGCRSQKSLARGNAIEIENKVYFDTFFADGGDYLRYVNLTNDGRVAAGDVQKVSRREYKVGVVVSVNKADLRKRLERDGIIKSLSHGF